ncbi:Myb/SANT-like domain-containing protein [Tanacetum coccineum]
MKRDNNLWKSLNNGETGLGWNASAQKLDCADEWWKMKIKEDPNFKKLQKKQSSLELQYAWGQLFGDVVAGGEDCISSVMNTKAFQEVHNENVEDEDVESDDDLDDTQEDKISPVSVSNEPLLLKEAFNRSHSSLRSYIERSFGILKKRWKILGGMPQFSVKTQIAVIMAAFALNNKFVNSDEEDIDVYTMAQHPNYTHLIELRCSWHETKQLKKRSKEHSNECKRF